MGISRCGLVGIHVTLKKEVFHWGRALGFHELQLNLMSAFLLPVALSATSLAPCLPA